MTDNAMTKRKKCNQKQYMVCQNMQWQREKMCNQKEYRV